MGLATGTVRLKRLPFWIAEPQTIELVNGFERVVLWTELSNKQDTDPDIWEFEDLPDWATPEDTGIRVDPASDVVDEFEFLARYVYMDILFRNTITFNVAHGDLVWTDRRGRTWVDANRQAWGERAS